MNTPNAFNILKTQPKLPVSDCLLCVKTISGKVIDDVGIPLMGVTISINGIPKTHTDNKGNFSVQVKNDDKVSFSFVMKETETYTGLFLPTTIVLRKKISFSNVVNTSNKKNKGKVANKPNPPKPNNPQPKTETNQTENTSIQTKPQAKPQAKPQTDTDTPNPSGNDAVKQSLSWLWISGIGAVILGGFYYYFFHKKDTKNGSK